MSFGRPAPYGKFYKGLADDTPVNHVRDTERCAACSRVRTRSPGVQHRVLHHSADPAPPPLAAHAQDLLWRARVSSEITLIKQTEANNAATRAAAQQAERTRMRAIEAQRNKKVRSRVVCHLRQRGVPCSTSNEARVSRAWSLLTRARSCVCSW